VAIEAEKLPFASSVALCEIGPVVPASVIVTLPVATTAPDLFTAPEKVVGDTPKAMVGALRLLKTAVALFTVACVVAVAVPAVAVSVGVPAVLSL